MAKQFNCLPSVILNIDDEYTAYCFNEACANLMMRLKADEKPVYREQKKENENKRNSYSNFSNFYENMEVR